MQLAAHALEALCKKKKELHCVSDMIARQKRLMYRQTRPSYRKESYIGKKKRRIG